MSARCSPTLLLILLFPAMGIAQLSPEETGQPVQSSGPTRPQTLPPPYLAEDGTDPAPFPLPQPLDLPQPGPTSPCPVPLVVKTIPQTRILLVPHENATTLPDWQLKPVEVGQVPAGPALDFREEKQIVTELRLQPRQVEQQVICNESKPVIVTDPHTGRCHTEYRCCPVAKTVKVTVYETTPVQIPVIVRVPCLKPGGTLVVNKLTLVPNSVPAIERRFQAETTHSNLQIVVPVPEIPLPAPCCPGCSRP